MAHTVGEKAPNLVDKSVSHNGPFADGAFTKRPRQQATLFTTEKASRRQEMKGHHMLCSR
jgi:hypothetical protein